MEGTTQLILQKLIFCERDCIRIALGGCFMSIAWLWKCISGNSAYISLGLARNYFCFFLVSFVDLLGIFTPLSLSSEISTIPRLHRQHIQHLLPLEGGTHIYSKDHDHVQNMILMAPVPPPRQHHISQHNKPAQMYSNVQNAGTKEGRTAPCKLTSKDSLYINNRGSTLSTLRSEQ